MKLKINCKTFFSLLVLGIDLMVLRMLSKNSASDQYAQLPKKEKKISLNFDTGFYLVIQAGLEVTL